MVLWHFRVSYKSVKNVFEETESKNALFCKDIETACLGKKALLKYFQLHFSITHILLFKESEASHNQMNSLVNFSVCLKALSIFHDVKLLFRVFYHFHHSVLFVSLLQLDLR